MKKIVLVFAALALSCSAQAGGNLMTGCYGEFAGLVMSADSKLSFDVGGTTFASLDGLGSQGVGGGLGIGCDYKMDRAVVGLFGRYDINNANTELNLLGSTLEMKYDPAWSVGARLGFDLNGATMIYGLVGYSWSKAKVEGLGISLSSDLKGWMIGGGLETVISGPWSAKLEYTFIRYDGASLFTSGPLDVRIDPDVHVVRGALIYRFGSMPDITK